MKEFDIDEEEQSYDKEYIIEERDNYGKFIFNKGLTTEYNNWIAKRSGSLCRCGSNVFITCRGSIITENGTGDYINTIEPHVSNLILRFCKECKNIRFSIIDLISHGHYL